MRCSASRTMHFRPAVFVPTRRPPRRRSSVTMQLLRRAQKFSQDPLTRPWASLHSARRRASSRTMRRLRRPRRHGGQMAQRHFGRDDQGWTSRTTPTPTPTRLRMHRVSSARRTSERARRWRQRCRRCLRWMGPVWAQQNRQCPRGVSRRGFGGKKSMRAALSALEEIGSPRARCGRSGQPRPRALDAAGITTRTGRPVVGVRQDPATILCTRRACRRRSRASRPRRAASRASGYGIRLSRVDLM